MHLNEVMAVGFVIKELRVETISVVPNNCSHANLTCETFKKMYATLINRSVWFVPPSHALKVSKINMNY